MKLHIYLVAILAMAAILVGCEPEPEVMKTELVQGVERVAVLPFADGPGAHGSGETVTGFITAEFVNHDRFHLVERSELKTLMAERDLQSADVIDASEAVELGRLLSVDAVVTGTVSQYEKEHTSIYAYATSIPVTTYKVGATLRMIDVATGEVIYAHSAHGESGSNYTQAGQQAADKLLNPLDTAAP